VRNRLAWHPVIVDAVTVVNPSVATGVRRASTGSPRSVPPATR